MASKGFGTAAGAPGEIVSLVNGPQVEEHLHGIASRMLRPEPAFALIVSELERQEQTVFESYGGKYVRTGALEGSLTGSDSGAVRKLTPTGLEFGSAVPYAMFQGTAGPGNHSGPSAVLKVSGVEREQAGATVLEYVVHGGVL